MTTTKSCERCGVTRAIPDDTEIVLCHRCALADAEKLQRRINERKAEPIAALQTVLGEVEMVQAHEDVADYDAEEHLEDAQTEILNAVSELTRREVEA